MPTKLPLPHPAGELPSKWPKMFPRLTELHLEFNDLYMKDRSGPQLPASLVQSVVESGLV